VHAGRLHWRIKDKFGLPIFVLDRGVVFDGYATKRLAIRRHTISKNAIVCRISNSEQAEDSQDRPQNNSSASQASLVVVLVVFDRSHGLDYTRQ
jgi:hypothetical protein